MSAGANITGFSSWTAWLVVALAAAPALAGCSLATTPGTIAPSDEAPSSVVEAPAVTPPVAALSPAPSAEQSIFRVRQPNSRVTVGSRVTIGGPAVQVTASSSHTLWIQEAGDSGRCDNGDDVVAYRAIVVTSKDLIPSLERGQLVEVEGIVAETDGHRTIADAVIRPSRTIGTPYEAHCDRDGNSLTSDALDGVLVLTAGTTAGQDPPRSDGTWSLAPCFGETPQIAIGAAMVTYSEWATSWHWVRGVITRNATAPRIEPRDAEDIIVHRADDACL